MTDSLTQQTISKPGVYPSYVENVQAATLDKRFGVVASAPVTASASGDTTLYTPATGYRIRLKWLGMASPAANTAEVLAIIKWGGGTEIYRWPMGNPGAFAHGSVREGAVNETLKINLSDAQNVYVNLDIEEF